MEAFNKKRIMVVVAHPDDEILGCGSTMNRLIQENNCVIRVVILGEGITSRSETRDPDKWKAELEIHRKNINSAQKIIGFEKVEIYDFPDNRFDSVALLDIVKVVEKEINDFKPEIVFTHFKDDLNVDHQLTYRAVITACRPGTNSVNTIFCFETPSATDWNPGVAFIPNMYVKISDKNLKAKQKAMDCYEFEKRDYPHPRSLKALQSLAEKRGVECGVEYSEAFILVRSIVEKK